jgi:hypothetical protein
MCMREANLLDDGCSVDLTSHFQTDGYDVVSDPLENYIYHHVSLLDLVFCSSLHYTSIRFFHTTQSFAQTNTLDFFL